MGDISNPAYDNATQSNRSQEVSPARLAPIRESLEDTTNLATDTYYYPSSQGASMLGFNDLTIDGKIIASATGTIDLYIEMTNDEDLATGEWQIVYVYSDVDNTVINNLSIANATKKFGLSANNVNYDRYRVALEVDFGTGNTVIIKSRKKA
jgi:hypothetical protein